MAADEVARILAEHPPIDLHADTPTLMRFGYDLVRRHRPPLPRAALGFHVDLPRLREGRFSCQFFGLVTFPFRRRGRARIAERQMALVEDAAARSGGRLVLARTGDDVRRAAAKGATGYAFGLEGAHGLEGSLEPLDRWAKRGLRYVTPAHFSRSDACPPKVGWGSRPDDGLSRFGKALVEACESLGIRVDVAHVSRRSFADVVAMSKRPVIVSHTGAASVYPMWRNIDDDGARAIARTGGVAGVIFGTMFLGGNDAGAVADHLVALWKTGGEDLPALGSDWDGSIVPPRDLRDPSQIGNLVGALLDRRVPERVVGKMLCGNVLRVMDA